MKEELSKLINKKVRLTCIFGKEPIFYTGVIISVNDNNVMILDKFQKRVIISLDSIKKVEEI